MNDNEQVFCEKQASIFSEAGKRFSCGSAYFAFIFMNSHSAEKLDNKHDLYNNDSLNMILDELEKRYPGLKSKKGTIYPSKQIYKRFKFVDMLSIYNAYHTFDPEYCIERINEFLTAKKESDYQIYRKIIL